TLTSAVTLDCRVCKTTQNELTHTASPNHCCRPYETPTHLRPQNQSPGFIPRLTTEAAFVAQFQLIGDPRNEKFADNGSYLKVTYDFEGGEKKNKNLVVTMFPFDAPQFRLGRSEEHTSELQSLRHLVCRLLL